MADIAKARVTPWVEDVLAEAGKDLSRLRETVLTLYPNSGLTRGLKKKNACFVTGMQW